MSDTTSIHPALPNVGQGRPDHLTSFLNEERVFPPPKSFSARAHIGSLTQYRKLYRESIQRPEAFWDRQAKAELVWFKPWKKVLQWKMPHAKWFVGGQLNVSYNCLDRHLGTPTANKAALIWEGEPAGPGQVGRGTHPHLPTTPSRGLPLRQRPQTPRHPERRPRHHLSAHGAGSRRRHARLRPHRRRPFRRLRRLQRPIRGRPHLRLPGQTGHHGRRRFPPRQRRAVEEKCG